MTHHPRRGPRRDYVGVSVVDRAFDRLIPEGLRHLSSMHWTPVEVAVRVASLLCPSRDMRILDVGSGVGKVCAIGALSAAHGQWFGVEQHEPLVASAVRLTRALGVGDRTQFIHGDVFSLDWCEFEALYFYNPFELTVLERPALVPEREVQAARVHRRLAALPGGTRVVTFHGFGGVMPPSFELLYHERIPVVGLDLALWIQRRARVAVEVS